MDESLRSLLSVIGIILAVCAVAALIGLALIARSIRRLNIPRNADFFTTMQYVPFLLVVLLDLLDFGLDVFSMPIIWIVLDRMGLPSLRNKAAIEALLPFTGPIPTFTLAWIYCNYLDRRVITD